MPFTSDQPRHKDLYLTKRNSYKRQIHASAVFEPAIRETEEPHTHALDRAVTGINGEDYTEKNSGL
jgi:hypothetical protein